MTNKIPEARRIVLPVSFLLECFSLDSENGELSWKERPIHHFKNERGMNAFNAAKAGKRIVDLDDGYLRVQISGKKYFAHRIVWAITYGKWPEGEIDHINGNTTDNRPINLRDVSTQENQRNQSKRPGLSTEVLGVSWHKAAGKWASYIGVDGKLKNLGCHNSLLDAVAARKSAEILYAFHKNTGRPARRHRIHQPGAEG